MKLNDVERRLLETLVRGQNIAGSNRAEDRAKTRLKHFGWIGFNRKNWRWFITPAGRKALE